MAYSRIHQSCNNKDCKILSSYVRIEGKWAQIGYFTSGCKKFALNDPEHEQELQEVMRSSRRSKYGPKKSLFVIYLEDLMS